MIVGTNLLKQILNFTDEGVLVVDPVSSEIVDFNQAATTCITSKIAAGERLDWAQIFPEQANTLREAQAQLNTSPELKVTRPMQVRISNNSALIVRLARVEDAGRELLVVVLKPASGEQGRMARLNQIYSVLSETNKIVANSQTRTDLFESICNIAVEMGGFRMAWIGINHGKQIIPVAHYGDDQGYLKQIKVTIDEQDTARGPVGQAFVQNTICCVNDTTTDDAFAPWKNAASERNYRSLAALPIRIKDKPIGVFAIYSAFTDHFDTAMLDLLRDMANDIELGLHWIDQETHRIEMEGKFRRLFQAIEQSATAVTITDSSGVIEYVNPHFTLLTGFSPGEVMGLTPLELATGNSGKQVYSDIQEALLSGTEWRGEIKNKAKDGSEFWTLQHIAPIRDEENEVTHFVSTASDITELHHAQETIEKLAYYDELTGLPNRRMFFDRLNQSIVSAQRRNESFAVCYLDLDGFKNINDSLGHEAGDLLLIEVAKRLKLNIRAKDTVSRLGGDEFTLILTDVKSPDDASVVSRNIITALAQPVALADTSVVVTTSIGIAIYPTDGTELDDLTRHADLAMYHAKAAGRNNYQYFTAEMNKKVQARMALEQRLRRAIENKEFEIRYQPIIDAVDGAIIAVEAVVEWHEGDTIVPPESFMPLAEETGLVANIGQWALRQACFDCIALNEDAVLDIKVSINISSQQFRNQKTLLEHLDSLIAESGVSAKHLQFEIDESILSEDVKASVETLRKIRSRGITCAVDNFGMGYSSLRYLKRFPVDIIKIDQSFVRDVVEDENDAAITSAIIALAHQLDFKVLAEGVETRKHLQFLERYWCDYLQGTYFSKPTTIAECVEYINKSVEHIG
ncbi:MAG: EAL domain-containing protein [Pseudomonadales bacterium]|nr:EAL domain-containing protein [Pseudomonadales bacterium]